MQILVQQIVVGNILKLIVQLPDSVLHRALAVPGQSPVEGHHITLIRLDDQGLSVAAAEALPLPSHALFLDGVIRYIDTGSKQSCYVEVTKETGNHLRLYAKECAIALGLDESAVESDRMFHVTLSNADNGHPRSSVGSPWKYRHQVV